MKETIHIVVLSFNYFVLFYFIIINFFYIMLTLLSFIALRRYIKENAMLKTQNKRLFQTSFYKPISMLVPAYNEEATISENVKSLLQLHYPEFEIIVVNDGSKDGTIDVLKRDYNLRQSYRPLMARIPCEQIRGVYTSREYRHLVVVDKANGGKADALNAGMNVSRFPLVCAIDSDSIIEAKAMLTLVRPFLDDTRTVAVGGIIRVANGCSLRAGEIVEIGLAPSLLPNFQIVEYLRAFLFGRVGWDMLNGLLVISGAFGLFRKDIVAAAGGYKRDTVGEDMELVVRLHRIMREQKRPYRITFVPEPVCWTEVPETLKVLARQRNRWQRGLIESLVEHRKMLFNPRYGAVGLLAMPFFFFFEMIGPIVELAGYIVFSLSYLFGMVDVQFALLFLAVAIILGVVLSVSSLVLEELSFKRYPRYSHVLKLFFFCILENFGYRQLHTWWRFKGIIDYLKGEKMWGAMERKGFTQKT